MPWSSAEVDRKPGSMLLRMEQGVNGVRKTRYETWKSHKLFKKSWKILLFWVELQEKYQGQVMGFGNIYTVSPNWSKKTSAPVWTCIDIGMFDSCYLHECDAVAGHFCLLGGCSLFHSVDSFFPPSVTMIRWQTLLVSMRSQTQTQAWAFFQLLPLRPGAWPS